MTRILNISSCPNPSDVDCSGVLVITPHRAAASALGKAYYSLPRLARGVLKEARGLELATDIMARHTLKGVLAKTIKNADPGSMAVRLKTIMQTVLRTGIDVDALIERGSPRVLELGLITKAYKAELLKDNLIDRAELLWAAAHCEPELRFLFIYGHHRARKEEIVFINAIAGEGSTFYLPCHGDGIFTGNREWAERLVTFGWQTADNTADSPQTTGQTLAANFTSPTKSPSGSDAIAYPNIESEVRGTLSRIKKMVVDGTDPYEIAIVCRDQEATHR
ncbi:MAG: hypothetical protein IPK01_00520 [Acidobacteria bacterium]|nr:hypothetical protein [Acidobacteriota bacterium]